MTPGTASRRCPWAETNDLMREYHDMEWGMPLRDDRRLFEYLVLDGAQAGLSWNTILQKRERYRSALDLFDYEKIQCYDDKKIMELLANPGIVRNKLKIASTIVNAKTFVRLREECGSFSSYLWQFVKDAPVQNAWKVLQEVPARTPLSDGISKDLKRRGFKFVGSTIIYAFIQAAGLVNDHLVDCPRHEACRVAGAARVG